MPREHLVLEGGALSPADVESVARRGRPVVIGAAAASAMEAARRLVEARAAGAAAVYGVNTGFGSLATRRIEPAELRQLQRNLVRSHAAGVGEPLPPDAVRAMMLVLAASLCRGRSGVRVELAGRLVDLLNRGVTPVVPSRGSVGASGDLAPLAHAALLLVGEGEAFVEGRRCCGAEALRAAGLAPLELQAKEGIALINGTHLMCAMGTLVLCDVERLVDAALAAAALAIDASRATDAFLDERLQEARGQPGPKRVARVLREALEGSQILASHRTGDPRVQDPYCLRAIPPVLGAVLDCLDFVRGVFGRELGAVTDNPLVFPAEGAIVSGACFHGLPLAVALDLTSIALSHLAGISERRVHWVLGAFDPHNPVHAHLSPQPGLHSGLMVAQYTAAACCNELQTLATPASVANIPTCAGIEDYNSMGATSAHQARAAVELATHVVAIELLIMAEALEYQRPLRSGAGVERTHAVVRGAVERLVADRPLAPDIAEVAGLIRRGAFGRRAGGGGPDRPGPRRRGGGRAS
jgi:histidine ammonia-lyase